MRGNCILEECGIGILGLGMYVPETIVDNSQIEEKLERITNEKIIRVTGIEERRKSAPNQSSSDLALIAARQAIKNAGLTANDIDLIIVATGTSDYKTPTTASILQKKLGIDFKTALDLNSGGCANGILGLITAAQFAAKEPDMKILVVGVENFKGCIDYYDKTSVYFGDGASAYIVGKVKKGHGFLNYNFKTLSENPEVLMIKGGGSAITLDEDGLKNGLQYLRMDGKKVWDFATVEFPKSVKQVVDDSGYSLDDIKMIIPHQSNINIIKRGMRTLKMPLEKTFVNIDKYGNTSGASVGIALYEALENNLFGSGDLVVLCGYGAGLGVGSIVMRW